MKATEDKNKGGPERTNDVGGNKIKQSQDGKQLARKYQTGGRKMKGEKQGHDEVKQ